MFDFNSEHGRWVQRDSDVDEEAPNDKFDWDAALFKVGVVVGAIGINTHVINIFQWRICSTSPSMPPSTPNCANGKFHFVLT